MTLNTRVRIKNPANARALHDWANQELLDAKNPALTVREKEIANSPGQGFAAWLITEHNGGKPFEFEPWSTDEEDIADERADFDAAPVGYVDLRFDTGYAFRDDLGRGCSALHADYIVRIAAHASELGATIAWHNEFTGEWHDGVEGLDEFASNGREAQDWFRMVALPSIAAQVSAERGA